MKIHYLENIRGIAEWVRQIDGIIGGKKKKVVKSTVKKAKAGKIKRPLNRAFPTGKMIYSSYKGKENKA